MPNYIEKQTITPKEEKQIVSIIRQYHLDKINTPYFNEKMLLEGLTRKTDFLKEVDLIFCKFFCDVLYNTLKDIPTKKDWNLLWKTRFQESTDLQGFINQQVLSYRNLSRVPLEARFKTYGDYHFKKLKYMED